MGLGNSVNTHRDKLMKETKYDTFRRIDNPVPLKSTGQLNHTSMS